MHTITVVKLALFREIQNSIVQKQKVPIRQKQDIFNPANSDSELPYITVTEQTLLTKATSTD